MTAVLKSPDMTAEEFRKWGYEFVDWVSGYLSRPQAFPVLSPVEPGDIRRQLPNSPPMQPESMNLVLRDLESIIVPGLTHWNHPAFFAYFPNTGSGPGILGEMVTAALNVNGMLWRTSPSATELEEVVLDWLRQMLGLSPAFKGIVYDTASISTFHALVAAREGISERNVRDEGICGPDSPRLRIYASEQAHSSVEKGAIAIGIGRSGLAKIPTDRDFRMDPAALVAAIERDLRDGWRPFCVVATVGTTSTTSIDPVPRIAEICEKYGLWLHVDAAYAGAAAILPELSHVLDGCDRADSLVMNPHKWLLTPMDFSAFYCRKPEILKRALSLVPDYLKTAEADKVTNYMDYTLQLGRRFRALKFWMVVRYFGVEGLRAGVREHIRLGKLFASLVASDPRFEVIAPVPFSTVCFRLKGDDAANQTLMDKVNASGKLFISHTRLKDQLVIRFAVGNLRSSEAHIRMAWDVIQSEAGRMTQTPLLDYVPRAEIEKRWARVRRYMDCDSLIVLQNVDQYYLTGTIQNGALWFPREGEPVLAVRKSFERARLESAVKNIVPFKSYSELPSIFPNPGKTIGLELDVVPVATYQQIAKQFKNANLIDGSMALRQARAVKTKYEIDCIREAARQLDRAFLDIPDHLREGVAEYELAARIEYVMRTSGHQGLTRVRRFNMEMYYGAVSFGDSAAYPHAFDGPVGVRGLYSATPSMGGKKQLRRGEPVIVDICGGYAGYIADGTRVYSLGPLSQDLQDAYKFTLDLNHWIEEQLRPGKVPHEIYSGILERAARTPYASNFMGAGENQVKFVAHGVGLELDEFPVIAPKYDTPLEPDVVMAVEPKVFFPGIGGVGVENTYRITSTTVERLTQCSQEIYSR